MSIPLNAENATQAWDDLAARLDRFLASWEGGAEPLLTEYLPDEPEIHRRMVLVELVKIDLEQRTSRGQPKQLEVYAAEFPELLENGEPPCELIYEEYHIRRGAGLTVTPAHYFERFPRSADALKRLMGTEGFSQTTQLVAAAPRMKGLAPGQNIDDFDLLVELGKGAFGSVYLARQISMGRLVALKVSADKGNEPRTLGQFDHPNIVRVFDQKRLTDRGLLLCYMTYAPGGTLQEVARKVRGTPAHARTGQLVTESIDESMQKAGQFTGEDSPWRKRMKAAPWPETVCKIGVQLAQALDYAHKKGVLHRDVKPANVLLSAEGSPKLADFNISFNSQIEGATAAHYFGGSLAYMSPEQLEACNPAHDRKPEDLDGRSDIFSLAVVLWELLHGERPFADEANGGWSVMLADMAVRRRSDKPRPPVASTDPIAHRLELVLHKAMSPDPAQRYADGSSMARELLLCLNPRAWDLTHNMTTGWRDIARREPIAAMVPFVLPPFILAGAFNLWYNQTYFLPSLKKLEPLAEQAFWSMVTPINVVLYPLGVALVWIYVAPMTTTLRKLARDELPPAEELRRSRARAMSLGHGVALIGVLLWIVAGIAFPTGIGVQVGAFSSRAFLHFVLAMTVSGIISCCLPFLTTTWLSVRVFFPALLANSAPEPVEQKQLVRLSWFSGIYFMVAPVAPLLAILLVVLSGIFSRPRAEGEPDPVRVLLWLIATSIVCLGLAYYIWQRIRTDLATLTIATRSVELSSTHTDSVEF